jgi:hypothetical protein
MVSPNWDEARHPRVPAGSSAGGEWSAAPISSFRELDYKTGMAELSQKALRGEQLTPEEQESLRVYSGESAADINAHLRGYSPGIDPSARLKGERATVQANLDSAIDKSSLPENLMAFRGISSDGWSRFEDLKPGDTFEDKGYVSTTLNRNIATQFARVDGPAGGVMIALLPKGIKALPLDVMLTQDAEREVLLPRNSKFRVREVNEDIGLVTVDVVN